VLAGLTGAVVGSRQGFPLAPAGHEAEKLRRELVRVAVISAEPGGDIRDPNVSAGGGCRRRCYGRRPWPGARGRCGWSPPRIRLALTQRSTFLNGSGLTHWNGCYGRRTRDVPRRFLSTESALGPLRSETADTLRYDSWIRALNTISGRFIASLSAEPEEYELTGNVPYRDIHDIAGLSQQAWSPIERQARLASMPSVRVRSTRQHGQRSRSRSRGAASELAASCVRPCSGYAAPWPDWAMPGRVRR